MNHVDDLIHRYFENRLLDHERALLLKLIQEGAIEEKLKDRIAATLEEELRKGEQPDELTRQKGEELFKLILQDAAADEPEIVSESEFVENKPTPFTTIIRYAAAFLILCVAGLVLIIREPSQQDISVVPRVKAKEALTVVLAKNSIQKIQLHDGSTITLQPGSEVRYPKKFGHKREVYLSGDAFFDVAKDPQRPFLVYANEITTKVLGTSFRIRANRNEKEIIVAVKTGKVSVRASQEKSIASAAVNQEITLTPNQQAVYKRNEQVVVKQIVKEPEVIVNLPTAKNSYVNASVIGILKNLSDSYGLKIHYDSEALSDCTLTSDTIDGEGLFEQLEIICNALGGTYTMESDASIVIDASGCKPTNVKPNQKPMN
jgi:ferric-dicitrate binding protein FerR (iron transport regulator)